MNVVVLLGTLSRRAERRTLPSGRVLMAHEVTVPGPEGRAESVPVVWIDPPRSARELEAGTEVVVVGRVRRRFFGAAGATASRTEVVAVTVVAARREAAARAAIDRAVATIAS